MSTETKTSAVTIEQSKLAAGGAAGLAAGLVFGVMLMMMMTPVIAMAIPALYGLSGLAAGWVVHLFHSVVFGLVFAAIVSTTSLRRFARKWSTGAVLGLAYGALVWVVAAALVMPVWLGVVGFPQVPPLPNFNPQSLVGHLVYGLILGVGYALVQRR